MKENFNFPFTPLVVNVLRAKDCEIGLFQSVIKKISDYYFKGEDDDLIIDRFIKVILIIDQIRNKYAGFNKQIDRTNLFCNLIGEHAAAKLSGSKRVEQKIKVMSQKSYSDPLDYVGVKLGILHGHVYNNNNLLEYYAQMSKQIEPAIEKFNQERELKPATGQIFSELLEMRKYGVKTSAFREGVLAQPGNYWIFSPTGYGYREFLPELMNTPQIKKRLEIMEKNCLVSISISKERELKKSEDMYLGNQINGFKIQSSAGFALTFDGELCGFSGTGITDLRSTFSRSGQNELYELLRANTIFRLYDLVVPLIIHKKYELPRFPERHKFLGLISPSVNFDPKLYLRRIRTLFDHRNEVDMELQAEMESALANTAMTKRQDHDIVCHIRRLPDGYKPSAKARRLAKEVLNYDLKPGETFVSQHNAENNGSKIIHRAITKH